MWVAFEVNAQLDFWDAETQRERQRVVGLLKRALERYDAAQLREYIKGIVDGNEVVPTN